MENHCFTWRTLELDVTIYPLGTLYSIVTFLEFVSGKEKLSNFPVLFESENLDGHNEKNSLKWLDLS